MEQNSREGFWTPLEKYGRDYLLWPLTRPLGIIPQAANIITIIGFGILGFAIYDFFKSFSFERQIWLLAAAWLTDFIDGPTARNNNSITAFGTVADHVRDYLIGFWMIALSFYISWSHGYWFMYWILSITIVGLFGIMFGNMLFQKEKRQEKPDISFFEFYKDFLLKDLVTTITARIQTVILAFGGVFYIAGEVWGQSYTNAGIVLLLIHLFVIGFYVHEVLQVRYEERAYQIRAALQDEIKKLRAKLKQRKEKRQARKAQKAKRKVENNV